MVGNQQEDRPSTTGCTFTSKQREKVQYSVQFIVYQFLAVMYQFSTENHIHVSYGRF